MLECSDIDELVRSGADPGSPDEWAACQAHLDSCPRCRRVFEAAGRMMATLAGGPSPSSETLPPPVEPTVADDIEPAPLTAGPAFADTPASTLPLGAPDRAGGGAPVAEATLHALDDDPYGSNPWARKKIEATLRAPASGGRGTADATAYLPPGSQRNGRPDASWPIVPGYDLIAKLGEGGMGVVFKARQIRLNRLVALKMIRGDGTLDDRQLDRFRLEAEAVAQVRHPNIVQIYEVGEVDGRPYFSIELVEGGGLDAKLAGTPQPARPAAEMLRALCSAIEAAHQARVVHRDLKPSNVVLALDGTPKVTDFGLAKRIEEEESSHTRTGDVMGSPSYMSPEQAKGQVHLVGPSSDIYSLGAILYEMLTGRPPFRGTSAWETVRQVAEDEPVPPSRLQPRVPRDLETIALKALSKDQARRYPTARAMGEDVGRYLAGEPILARPVPFWERGLKWARRRPATAALSAVAAASAVAIVAGSIWYAMLLQDRKRAESYRAARLVADGREVLSQVRAKRLLNDFGAAEALLSEFGKDLSKEESTGRRDPGLAEIRERLGAESSAVRLAREADEELKAFRADLDRFRGLRDEALFLDTWFDGLRQAGPEARGAKAREALAVFTRAGDRGPSTLMTRPKRTTKEEWSEVLNGSAEMILVLAEAEARRPGLDPKARAAEALRVLESAHGVAPALERTRAFRRRKNAYLAEMGRAPDREPADAPPQNAFDHFLAGLEAYKQGRLDDAIPEFEAARVGDRKLFWARALLAISYVRTARPAEARIVLDECLEDRDHFAWLHILRGYAIGQLGLAGGAAPGRPGAATSFDDDPARAGAPGPDAVAHVQAAEADFARALEGLKPDDKDLRYTLHLDRGIIRFRYGRLAEAAADFEAAIGVAPARPNAYINLAGVYYWRDDLDGAIARLSEALGRGADRPGQFRTLQFRALVHQRKAEQAVARGDRQAEARERRLALDDYAAIRFEPTDRPEEVASVLVGRARLLLRDGRTDEASKALDEAIAAYPKSREAHQLKAESLLNRGLLDEAIAAADVGIAAGVNPTDLHAIRGRARFKREDFTGAILDFDRSLGRRPAQPDLLVLRGNARFYLGLRDGISTWNPRLALDDYEEATRLDPASAAAYSGRGNVLAELDRPELAMADADRSLDLDAGSPLNLLRCARIYARAADAQVARARTSKVAPASPRRYREKAVELLVRAIEANDRAGRRSFDPERVLRDQGFKSVRLDPRVVALLREPGPETTSRNP